MLRNISSRFFIIVLLFLSVFQVFSQTNKKQFNNGLDALYADNIKEAYAIFNNIYQNKPDYRDLDYFYSLTASLSGNDIEVNKKKFSEFQNQTDKYPFFYYWLGRIEAESYESDKAITAYQSFLRTPGYKNPQLVKETKARIKDLKKQKEMLSNERPIQVVNLNDLNTSNPEVSAQYINNTVVYISEKLVKQANNPQKWSIIELKDNYEEIQVIGNRLALRKGNTLYTADYNGESITNINNIGLDVLGIIYSFHMSAKLDFVYLSLDSKKYGADLYYSEKNTGGLWSIPVLLNESINSDFNETTPFFDNDNQVLYFSSDRPDQIGNYDVFSAKKTRNGWERAQNLGAPINSPDDELYYKGISGGIATFSSNRIGGKGDLDLYAAKPKKSSSLKVEVINQSTQTKISDGKITFTSIGLFKESINESITDGLVTIEIDPISNYNVVISIDGREVFNDTYGTSTQNQGKSKLSETFAISAPIVTENTNQESTPQEIVQTNVDNTVNSTVERNITYPKTLSSKISRPDINSYLQKKKAISSNVYFDFDKYAIRSSELTTLNQILALLQSQNKLSIELAGHTDVIGPSQTNQRISELRANQVKKWLVKKGIDPSRIVTQGYSELIPMASNNFEEEGRAYNRRVEFLMINN